MLGAFSVSSGHAHNVLLENGGAMFVETGHSASDTVIRQGGAQYVSNGGSAMGTAIEAGGMLVVYDNGSASTVAQSSGGALQTYTGATVSGTNALGGFSVSGGHASNVLLENGGRLFVEAGGDATGSVLGYGGIQDVLNGGSAVSTTVQAGGYEQVYSGGSTSATLVSGGTQYIMGGGIASGTTVNGYGTLNNYGSAISSVINSGTLYVQNGGRTTSSVVKAGGSEYVNYGGVTSSTTVSAGASQYVAVGGSASSTTLSGGIQTVYGNATSTVVTSGGGQYIYSGGTASDTTVNLGVVNVASGGTALRTAVNSGGAMYVLSGSTVTSTVVSGGVQYINNGAVATATSVSDNGWAVVSSGGALNSASVNSGGTLSVFSGGVATGPTVNAGGVIAVADGGNASGVFQAAGAALQASTRAAIAGTNALGAFSVSGGQANNVLLENGGALTVKSGDISHGTVVNAGGSENVYGVAQGTIVNANGALSVFSGGTALQATINSGGSLSVSRGGVASDTTVAAGGLLNIAEGAILTLANNSFVNEGITTYDTSTSASLNTNLTGSGQLTKNGTGTLTLGGSLSQSQVNLNAGSLVMDGLLATTDIIALAGTSLSLINSATLTGIIDPTDVTIDSSSTWNITGDSLVDNLTNAGNIVFVPSQGTFTPHTLTATNLIGNGGTITLNTVAGDSSSPIDKVVIDGGSATGSTGLRVLNRGGLGAQTTGNGIAVVQAINGATTGTGAFSLKQPLVAGAYAYSLYRNGDQSWYLTSQQVQPGQASASTGPVNYRAAMWSYAAMPVLSMDYDRLVAGSSDTRFRYAPDSRIWGRVAAGKLSHPDSGSLTGASVPESSGTYSFLQLGGDLWQLDGANADWRAGVYGATGLLRSDVWRDIGSAHAGTDRDTVYTGGAYLSGRSHDGLHVEGVLQASRHSLSASSNDNTRLSTHGTGWLASAEIGQSFSVSPALALEPQLQYTVQGVNLNDGQDEVAALSWRDSRQQSVRAGLKVGTQQDAKAKLAWWVTPSVTQSFGGHSGFTASAPGVSASDASFRSNLSGTSVGLNGGVNARIRQNVTLGVQGGWSESLHGSEAGGYYGLVNLGVSFR